MPASLDALARTSARLLVVAAAVVVAALAFDRLRLVVLPVALALLAATLLTPLARAAERRGVPPSVAAFAGTAGLLTVTIGVLVALAPTFAAQLDDIGTGVSDGIERVEAWLADEPLGLPAGAAEGTLERVRDEIRGSTGQIADGLLSGVTLALEVVAGALLGLVVLFFLVRDGRAIWTWLLRHWPPARRARIDAIGARAWAALGGYVRGVATVALAESLMVAIALALIGMPLVLPLAVLTFFAAFIPVLGAILVGATATLVALVDGGLATAALVLVAFIVIQQLESNVLHPVIVGRATAIHPLALLLAVTTGGVLAGIVGALLAGPVVAVASAVLYDGADPQPRREPSATDAVTAPPDRAGSPSG